MVGGGTGGHVYPALAVARALKLGRVRPDIVFVGTRGGLEQKLVPEAGFRMRLLRIRGLQRGRFFVNLRLLFLVPFSLLASLFILLYERPGVVFGTGGYVCMPVLAAAVLLGRTIMLQVPDAYPGLTLRLFSRFAQRLFLGFEEARQFLSAKGRAVVTGNPVREDRTQGREDVRARHHVDPSDRVLLIFGGSQGSVPINTIVLGCIRPLLDIGNLTVFWQTGTRDHDKVAGQTRGLKKVKVMPYIENIYDYYRTADLALCRAGAMTLAELALFGLPAVFIPLPSAAEDHQTKNARMVQAAGGGTCLPQARAEKELVPVIKDLFGNRERLSDMGTNMKKLHRENSAQTIAAEVCREFTP
jgi:UDP-N-acetylglucosamine--N-acetylmuramyl-(pentapeptide) pyrophosphoryl-undecaprenol N-acetylglucosamine transferase